MKLLIGILVLIFLSNTLLIVTMSSMIHDIWMVHYEYEGSEYQEYDVLRNDTEEWYDDIRERVGVYDDRCRRER